jgi:hypothetical protein
MQKGFFKLSLDGFSFFRQPKAAMKRNTNNKMIRCPRLGDEITFSYCLQESVDLPCSRIVRCWSPFFDVESFLKANLAPEQWDRFANAGQPDKMTSLLEIIETAKAKK